MKKVILAVFALLFAGCTGAFLPIEAPDWEKGQTYLWDVHAEASGSASYQEPGSPPITTAIPPTDLLDGTVRMTVLDVLNQTFEWYPVALESALTFVPEAGPDAGTETAQEYIALRASDLAQSNVFVEQDPFTIRPGPFMGGFEFPVQADTRVTEDLIPELPGLATFVLEAGSTESISTPAGTFDASSLVWHIDIDEEQVMQLVAEEEELSSFEFSFTANGALWFSAETQFLVQSTAKFSGNFKASYDAPEGTYKASGSGTALFRMDLAEHGIVAVPSLEEVFANGDPGPLPSIPIGQDPDAEPEPTTLVLSANSINAATDFATASVTSANGNPPNVAYYLFDLNGGLVDVSSVTDEWMLPSDRLGGFIVVADVLGQEFVDPAPALFIVEYDGAVANQCSDLTLPVDDCEGVQLDLSYGIDSLEVAGSNIGLHTLSARSGDVADSDLSVGSTSLSFTDPPAGSWNIEGEGEAGTAVAVTVKATVGPEVSNSVPTAWTQPILPQPAPVREPASSLVPWMQWLPAPVQESVLLQDIGTALVRPVADGMLLGNH